MDTFDNLQKRRTGVNRIWHASLHSMAGLRAAWSEGAFRAEVALAVVLLPAAGLLARSLVEAILLAGSIVLVLIVELLNTAIESTVDRTGLEWHALSKRAKDVGSAAVLLALVLCGAIWLAVAADRFLH